MAASKKQAEAAWRCFRSRHVRVGASICRRRLRARQRIASSTPLPSLELARLAVERWGYIYFCQLGNGSTTNSSTPV